MLIGTPPVIWDLREIGGFSVDIYVPSSTPGPLSVSLALPLAERRSGHSGGEFPYCPDIPLRAGWNKVVFRRNLDKVQEKYIRAVTSINLMLVSKKKFKGWVVFDNLRTI